MLKILSFILSPLSHVYYALVFGIIHPIQIMAHRLFGEKQRLRVIRVLNYLLTRGPYLMLSRTSIHGKENIPDNSRPIIIVSNHQSFNDIPIIGHLFRENNVKFVAKHTLGKGLPTISYNLVHGCSALVDRNNGAQSVREIFKLGRHIEANNFAACIFPEGTRSKTGELKEFFSAGVGTLLRSAPNAIVVPFAIKGHSQLIQKSELWLKVGQKIDYTIFPAIDPKTMPLEELMTKIREQIASVVNEK